MPRIVDPLLVAAIDFGTSYSGYAIQFKHEYEQNPTKIKAPQPWNGGKQNLMSYKTPTCLLLDKDKEFVCFGFEAEQKYAELSIRGNHEDFYYFKEFKMKLQDRQGPKKGFTIEDETQKLMPALKVFSMSIDCLVKHLMKMLKHQGTGVEMKDILWVLTVPAIWDDAAKDFMKKAAEEANIGEDHLLIALEPEVASLYCQFLPTEKFISSDKTTFSDAKPGTVYMVADLGGGTTDITIHEKLSEHKLKEVYKATGGPWGGTAVDSEFWQLFISIAGAPTMMKFKKTMKYDYLDFQKELECVKRTFSFGMRTEFAIKFPASLNEICQEKHKLIFKDLVNKSKHATSVSFIGDKMMMKTELVARLFNRVTDNIMEHISNLLKNTTAGKRVAMILMVGGFSESPYVQEQATQKLKTDKLKIFTPKGASLSVLKGAVIFGRKPEAITTRVMRYTYGVEITQDFIDGVHPVDKKIRGDPPRCEHLFHSFIQEGTPVEIGHQVDKVYTTATPNQKIMAVNVFVCSEGVPQFITDKTCRQLGTLKIDIANPSPKEKLLRVRFIFGRTSLVVVAVETEENEICMTNLIYLNSEHPSFVKGS